MEFSTFYALELLAVLLFGLYSVWNYFCAKFTLFRAQGVPGPRPIPVFGTWWGSWDRNPHEIALDNYKLHGKIWCTIRGRQPVLHIADLDLLRSVMVKDSFEHFGQRNRRPVTGENEYVNKTMSMLHGEQWKVLRNLAMGAISKPVVEERVLFVNGALQEFVEHWGSIAGEEGGWMDLGLECELLCEEVMMNYTAGAKLGTLGRPDHPFFYNARKTMEAGEGSFFGTITLLYPKLVQWLCPVLDTGNEYFVELSKRILQERTDPAHHQDQHHLTTEPDLIDRLLSCLNGNDTKGHQHINEFVAVAQITSTILTGYDLGTVLTRVLQCLTVNPEAQARCRREIREELDKFDGEIGFKLLTGLPYVEQCIREALRLYPTTSMTYRVCTKDKQYPGLLIPQGTSIECPIYIIQRDPAVYPEPLQYNPDRFAPGSSRSDRDPFLFMSFGQGPRGCFAQRFSMIVLKHCLVHLLSEFQFYRVAETRDPIKFTTGPSGMLTARDVFVGIRRLDS